MNLTNPKLVTITRQDLLPAQQAVQSAHAAIDFIFEHPNKASPWHLSSNYLVMLVTKDEDALKSLIEKCHERSIDHTVFREPDIDNQITGIA